MSDNHAYPCHQKAQSSLARYFPQRSTSGAPGAQVNVKRNGHTTKINNVYSLLSPKGMVEEGLIQNYLETYHKRMFTLFFPRKEWSRRG